MEDVSRFLDHSSLAVTTVYLRRLEGERDKNWDKVARGHPYIAAEHIIKDNKKSFFTMFNCDLSFPCGLAVAPLRAKGCWVDHRTS